MSPPIIMNFKNQEDKVQEAIEQEEACKEDVKNANMAKKTGEKERKKLWKQKEEEKKAENRNLKAAISRRKAATQTRMALEGKDPEPPKVGIDLSFVSADFFRFRKGVVSYRIDTIHEFFSNFCTKPWVNLTGISNFLL